MLEMNSIHLVIGILNICITFSCDSDIYVIFFIKKGY